MLLIELVESNIKNVRELDKEEVIVSSIEDIFKKYNLTITQKTTLTTKKGSLHWHLKNGNQKGVLEVTYWIPYNRLWLEIHDNRRAAWNESMIVQIAHEFAQIFGGHLL
jgi:hypothetical protein